MFLLAFLVAPAVATAVLWIRRDHARGHPVPFSPQLAPNFLSILKPHFKDGGASPPLVHLRPDGLSSAIVQFFFRKRGGENLKCHRHGKSTSRTPTTTRIVAVVPQSWGRRGGAIGVGDGGQEANFPALRQPSNGKVGARGPNMP